MAAAICAMHYTGMAATTFVASGVEPDLTSFRERFRTRNYSAYIIVTLLVLGLAMLSSLVDRRFEAQALELAVGAGEYGTRSCWTGRIAGGAGGVDCA